MTADIAQFTLFLIILLALVKPLGWYMARVYEGTPCGLEPIMQPIERLIYKITGIQQETEMRWQQYLIAMLLANFLGFLFVYAMQRCQAYLPLNPQSFANVPADTAFNTAISFATNTNWQSYSGESSLSYLTQMLGLTVQNFVSAATGMALLIALIRGLSRQSNETLGNFWTDLVRGILYILLPLSLLLALILASQGVIQNFKPYQSVHVLDVGNTVTQTIPMGPVASQIAIKQLGTNGGGFFNTNSAHPFENPNPLTNFLELLAIILIPASLTYTFGRMVGDQRQGWALFIAMLVLFIPLALSTLYAEYQTHPEFAQLGIAHHGNMEGKESRFGIGNSAIWAATTTATSNGSVNSMHDSFTPLGALPLLLLMHFGEVIFGGVGSGLYGMLMLVIITVFVAGLMVGRTPEYLGKKIEPYEMKMAALSTLVMPLTVLIFTALSSVIAPGFSSIANPGAHGFTEMLYAWTSMGNNNGSAMAGLNADTFYYNTFGGIIILIGRYWIVIPVLAIAGSLVRKKKTPINLGTLPTDTPFFVGLLIVITATISALSFFPALALGPFIEHILLWK